jgi:hypothetical protein
MEAEIPTEKEIATAMKFYATHKARVIAFQKNNPEKMKLKSKKYHDNIKEQNPERYLLVLEAKRRYYKEVIKPKRDARKEATEDTTVDQKND